MKDSTGAAPAPDPSQSQIISQGQQLPAQDTEHSENEEGYDFNVVDYLMSDKGHQAITQVLGIFAENHKAAHESQKIAQQATAELDKQKLELQKRSWTAWMWLQIAVFVVAISVAATLAWHGKLDGAMGTLIGTLVGYTLGRARQN